MSQVSDPVADLLTRIRNGSQAGLKYTQIPASRLKIAIVQVLKREGFITDFRLIRDDKQGMIKVALKYSADGAPVIQGLQRVSTPGCRVYSRANHLPRVRNGLGCAILSTPKGVLTSRAAKLACVGGEILAYVW